VRYIEGGIFDVDKQSVLDILGVYL